MVTEYLRFTGSVLTFDPVSPGTVRSVRSIVFTHLCQSFPGTVYSLVYIQKFLPMSHGRKTPTHR